MADWRLKILDSPQEMELVENLQGEVWTGNDRDIVPAHLLLAAVRNGGLVIGAFETHRAQEGQTGEDVPLIKDRMELSAEIPLVGFVFGFPAADYSTSIVKHYHYSHMLGVHPSYRDHGIGFLLKRAQWQMVRRQGVEVIRWTYDPLQSRNAHLNISRLGAVTNTYRRDYYGVMRDGINIGVASDRFVVDWWINSKRVNTRLSKKPRLKLDLAHFLAGEVTILNPTTLASPLPGDELTSGGALLYPSGFDGLPPSFLSENPPAMLLVEIPSDFQALRAEAPALSQSWRMHTRMIFEALFERGYLVTDFIHLPKSLPGALVRGGKQENQGMQSPGAAGRSFYVLSFGESTL